MRSPGHGRVTEVCAFVPPMSTTTCTRTRRDGRASAVDVCRRLSVDLEVLDAAVATNRAGHFDEGAARAARYRALDRIVSSHDVLCTAHSSDDHVETVLLNLVRGAGPRGLAGIPEERRLGAGIVARPVLGVSRAVLRAYARETGLPIVRDPANEEQRFARVLLRRTVLPALEARWPGVRTRLERAATLGRECADLLDELGAIDLDPAGGVGAAALDAETLAALEPARRRKCRRRLASDPRGRIPGRSPDRADRA